METSSVCGKSLQSLSQEDSTFVYIRENSVNETRETSVPAPNEERVDFGKYVDLPGDFVAKKKVKANTVTFDRQNSLTPFVITASKQPTCSEFSCKLDEVDTEELIRKYRKLKKSAYCLCSTGLFMLSLAVFLFVFMIFKTLPMTRELVDLKLGATSAFNREHVKTTGNFVLDQDRLRNTSQIRWLPDIYSIIETEPNSSCVKVTLNGDYFVISRFTFRIPLTEKRKLFTHNLSVKSNNDDDVIFKRQYVNIPAERVYDYRKASVFAKSFHVKAGERICAYVTAPDLLYASGLDNDVTIVRLYDDISELPQNDVNL